ncbi:MAG: DUF499 domain-containing protein [Planctomycetia bacterium]|nr:DUF499 domain-containing protein [Planctomycetia bacterium]
MLGLQLRDEFLGTNTPGTAISLRRNDNMGAAQQPADRILEITYPTGDVQMALRALSVARPQKPIALLGDRGRGKSHIMAVMHHATMSPDVVQQWARSWGNRLGSQALANLDLQTGYFAISEAVHNHEYPFLWDLIFDRHPHGQRFRGRFEQSGSNVPSRSLLEEMFRTQPVVLILDEFQKWFDGLPEVGRDGSRQREMASNFVQNLSELSRERPELVLLAISVLNNTTEAFQQVHRDTPVVVNFLGPTAKQDRQLLLLHRLFRNRDNIARAQVDQLVAAYAGERYRLRFSHLPVSERNRIAEEVVALWPFSPELVNLLEDHILMAQAAQETRDLIRILAAAYRERGDAVPLLTAADFFVDTDTHGVQALLESIAAHGAQSDLLEIAQRNLDGIKASGVATAHSREIISALWLRSMTPGREAGGTKEDLHLDVTRDAPIDDNAFLDELLKTKDNSVNIHGSDNLQGRIWFGREENAKTKVRSTARNDRLWAASGTPGATTSYPGKDLEHIRKTLRYILEPENRQSVSKVVVLGPNWEHDPWSDIDEADRPATWNQPILLVVPAPLDEPAGAVEKVLGTWLATKVQSKRNTVRFLLPATGRKNLYQDSDLSFIARCAYLTSQAWKDDPHYRGLKDEFERPLRDNLRTRFDRFAILTRWNFRQPEQCRFDVERIDVELVRQKGAIPVAIDEQIKRDLFDATEFQTLVVESARNGDDVSRLIDGLREPPPSAEKSAIPFLGDRDTCEEVCKVAAKGKVVFNVAGTWVARLPDHADDDEALRYIRPKAFRGTQEMRQVQLALPAAAGTGAVSGPTPTQPTPQPTPGTLFPPEPTTTGGTQQPGGGTPPPTTPGTGTAPPITPIPPVIPAEVRSTNGATTVVNLIGSFEQWGVPADASLDMTKIEFEGLSVQQAKAILQRLPSHVRAKLEVTFRPNGGGESA